VDLSTSDQARAREFYGAVFGSQFNLLQETAAMPLVPAGEQTPAGVSQ
jgi:predicted enzyme related to lactoylglutathione lyase